MVVVFVRFGFTPQEKRKKTHNVQRMVKDIEETAETGYEYQVEGGMISLLEGV